MKLEFDSKNLFYKEPFGAVAVGTAIAFRVAIIRENIDSSEAASNHLRIGLVIHEDEREEVWIDGESLGESYLFSWKAEKSGLFFYRFRAWSGNLLAAETTEHQLTVYASGFQTPDWLSGGLMYQIFPDRFARSSSYIPPEQNKDYRIHKVWGELPDSGPDETGIVWNKDFFGGNLKGIQEQLPYLEGLGVTVIYLNPIFRAFSNHRYDTANYMEIDPLLGTEQDFKELCQAAMTRGIRIIIDGVFNHTGSHSVYFNKDGAFNTVGAFQSKESPYYQWYSFQKYPERYDAWWGIDTLPSVNEMEDSYRDYIIRSEDSVIKHWLSQGASGIRLDVADELPDQFLEEVRGAVKSVRPDGAVIGEVWEDASNKMAYGLRRRYFQGNQLDSVMNYPLKDWLIAFLSDHRDGVRFQDQIMTLMENYPQMCAHSLMNILGTHDTERILTVLSAGTASYEEARQKFFLALLVWAFMPGIPCIYYGDELGMEGGRDPFNRCCFEPEKGKKEIRIFYNRLLHFRRGIEDIGKMTYEPGNSGMEYFSFCRMGKGQRILIYLNLGKTTKNLTTGIGDEEMVLDFVNCGNVSFDTEESIQVHPGSGIVLQIIDKK